MFLIFLPYQTPKTAISARVSLRSALEAMIPHSGYVTPSWAKGPIPDWAEGEPYVVQACRRFYPEEEYL